MKYLKGTLCIILVAVLAFTTLAMQTFAVADSELPEDASYVSGDADGNAIVNSADALTVLNHTIGEAEIKDVVRLTAADVNGDEKINSTDALYILNFKVGNITEFPRGSYNLTKLAGNMMIDGYTGCVVDAQGVGLVGYGYDMKAGVFYATGEGFQREFGYGEMYDRVAVVATMPLDTTRIKFNYDNKDWMVQLWKGFYGMVMCGCEVGIYNRPEGMDDEFTAYNVVTLDYYQDFTVDFYYSSKGTYKLNGLFKDDPVFTRSTKTWWFTAFSPSIQVLPETNIPKMLVDCTIKFNETGLYEAFIDALGEVDNIFANYTGKSRSFEFEEVNREEDLENGSFIQLGDNTVRFIWQ